MHRSTWPCRLLENTSPWDRKTQRRLWSFWRRSAWFRFTTVRFHRWLAILRSSPHWRREKARKSTCCSPARRWSFSPNSKFSFSPLAKSLEERGQKLELSLKGIIYLGDDVSDHHRR